MLGIDCRKYCHSVLVVFCYLIRNDSILLIRRNSEPYMGHLTIPGGKKERGETPMQACIREVREETGLRVNRLSFSGMVSNIPREGETDVLSMYYLSRSFDGKAGSSPEGDINWYGLSGVFEEKGISPFFRLVTPYVLDPLNRVFQGIIRVDRDGDILNSEIGYMD